MQLVSNTNILIVGLGLMGGSYAKALSRVGFHVHAIAHKQADIDYALEQGFIEKGAAFPDPELIGSAELVIFALYPHVFKEWIEENQKYFRFLEEMGIKVVCTIGYPGTCIAYTRALAEDYPEGIDLYSDIDSKINYHKAMAGYLIFVIAMTLFAALLNLTIGINNLIMYGSSISILNLICGGLMIGLFIAAVIAEIRLRTKINRLKKERAIHE